VRLAALNLEEISEVDLDGLRLDPGIPRFRVFSPRLELRNLGVLNSRHVDICVPPNRNRCHLGSCYVRVLSHLAFRR